MNLFRQAPTQLATLALAISMSAALSSFCNAQPSKHQSKKHPVANPRTSNFDAPRAYEHVRRLVAIGPRPPGSTGIKQAQSYIIGELKSYGCAVEEHDFVGSSPIGDLPLKNIVAKARGTTPGIVLYATHYDTVRLPNFVGADDGGSGTGVMLELARNFCARKNKLNVWIAFFDGEEAQGHWTDKSSIAWTNTNSTYGSRELAATMALSGDLKQLRAMILADMIGPSDLKIKRDSNSTPWLVDLVWGTAANLGYSKIFVNEPTTVSGDDHLSFTRRNIAACDIIDFDVEGTYWHTSADTLDKVDPHSLGIAGQVFVELLSALENKFATVG